MPSSTISTSPYGRFLRPALAAAALMACAVAAQAADVAAPVNATVGGAKTMANGKTATHGNANSELDVGAAATTDAKNNMAAEKNGKAVSDAWITTKVKSEILANSGTKGIKVHVTTKGGVVALKGKLPTQDAVDQVKTLAASVKGVHSVNVSGLVVAGS